MRLSMWEGVRYLATWTHVFGHRGVPCGRHIWGPSSILFPHPQMARFGGVWGQMKPRNGDRQPQNGLGMRV